MTEVSLGLAMGFFALMILTMVSMEAGPSAKVDAATDSLEKLKVVPPVETAAADAGARGLGEHEVLLVYFDGRFYDSKLKAVDPAAVATDASVVLAVPASATMSSALSAQRQISASVQVITTLNSEWIERLENLK